MLQECNCSIRKCVWYKGVFQPDGTEQSERHVCLAFPEFIPMSIAYGKDLHLKVLEDQAGDFAYQPEE